MSIISTHTTSIAIVVVEEASALIGVKGSSCGDYGVGEHYDEEGLRCDDRLEFSVIFLHVCCGKKYIQETFMKSLRLN